MATPSPENSADTVATENTYVFDNVYGATPPAEMSAEADNLTEITAAQQSARAQNAHILERIRSGDTTVWAEVVDVYGDFITQVALSFRLPAADQEDVIQDTLLQILIKQSDIRQPEMLRAWIHTTARRICGKRVRHESRVQYYEPSVFEAIIEPDTSHAVINSIAAECIWASIENLELTVAERNLLTCLRKGLDHATITRTIRMPRGSIGPTRGRLIDKIRRSLGTEAVDLLID